MTSFQLLPSDGFPKKICFKCSTEVSIAYNLKQKLIAPKSLVKPLPKKKIFRPEVKIEPAAEPIEEPSQDVEPIITVQLDEKIELDDKIEEPSENEDSGAHSPQYYSATENDLLVEMESKSSKPVDKKVRLTTCYQCDKVFSSHSVRYVHVCREHAAIKECSICHLKFRTASKCERHLMYHRPNISLRRIALQDRKGDEKNACYICNKVFPSSITRYKHLRSEHKQENDCDICQAQFTRACHYERHLRMHELTRMGVRVHVRKEWQYGQTTEVVPGQEPTCYLCQATFSSRQLKYQHLCNDHQQQNDCGDCKMSFDKASKFEYHMRRHSLPPKKVDRKSVAYLKFERVTGDPNTCYICLKQFPSFAKRYHHLTNEHAQENECEPCSLKFSRAGAYERHMMRHYFDCCNRTKEKKWHCDLCPSVLKSHRGIQDHMEYVHLDIRKFACTKCDKRFNTSVYLRRHLELLHGQDETEKNFKCANCDAAYVFEGFLRTHMLKCNVVKPPQDDYFEAVPEQTHQCKMCPREFLSLGALRSHSRAHFDGSFCFCTFCDESFSDFKSAFAHISSSHTENDEPKEFEIFHKRCYICNLTFPNARKQRKHVKTDHADYAGKSCPRWPACNRAVFPGPSSYEQHLRNHLLGYSAICEECGSQFSSQKVLNQHVIIRHATPMCICDYCGSKLLKSSLKRHLQLHLDIHLKYPCTVCPGVSFNHGGSLANHNLRVHGGPARYVCRHCGHKYNYSVSWKDHEIKCGAQQLFGRRGDCSGHRSGGVKKKRVRNKEYDRQYNLNRKMKKLQERANAH